MKLKKCSVHGYTLDAVCKVCGEKTKDAHYKFVKLRDVNEIKKR